VEKGTWLRVKKIFSEALDLPAAERDEYVKSRCGDDQQLFQEVISLLAAHQRAEDGPDPLSDGPTNPLSRDALGDSVTGQRVGPYRLVRLIGEGGMGVVHLGERADGQFERRVAVKLIRPGMGTRSMVKRFELERHTLAALEHPNISRLLDAGTTDSGLPYLVMEYVDGLPLDAHCDAAKLGITARLELFLTACRAVQHAHRNLVVHRDLKPGNILVDGEGQLKLLDFGIVKLLPGASRETANLTRTAQQVMTPAYASPEQVLGRPVTTSSDVYSLGIVLYELLTGHLPYRLRTSSPRELLEVVCEQEPTRPSAAVGQTVEEEGPDGAPRVLLSPKAVATARQSSPERLRRRLSGDLDLILLMTLRKEPERRYASVEALAEDIRRYLEGLPVSARDDSFGYRTGRFIRRHTLGVTVGAAIVLLLSAGLASTWIQMRVASSERDRAQAEAEKARAVTGFLQDMLASADPGELGRDVTVAEVLDQASLDLGPRLATAPDVEAAVRSTIGTTYRGLGRYEQAEIQHQLSLDLVRQVHGDDHPAAAAQLTHLAVLSHDRGELDAAGHGYREALAMFTRLGIASGPDLANALNSYGALLRSTGRPDQAEGNYEKALELYEADPQSRIPDIASVHNNLAVLYQSRGDLDLSEASFRQALALTRADQGDSGPDVARCLHNLAGVLHSRSQLTQAEALYREALTLRRSALGNHHPEVASNLINLADVLLDGGHAREAQAIAREGLELQRQILPDGHPWTARGSMVLARALLETGEDPHAATELAQSAVRMRRESLPANHWLIASSSILLGRCLTQQGRYAEAETTLLGGHAVLADDRGATHDRTVAAVGALADLYARWDKDSEAERWAMKLPPQ